MKTLILLCVVFSLSAAKEILDASKLNLENYKFDLDKKLEEDFLQKYEQGDSSEIIAVINDYADKIFKNIEVYAVANDLDPLKLDDVEQNFLTASITLTNGSMYGVATLNRADDVTISYGSETKIIELNVPIIFSNLQFTYDYHVIVLLIGPKGSIVGTITDFEMDIVMQFDFNTSKASIVNIDTINAGRVSLTFHGNALTDIVANILSEFVTTILLPVLNLLLEGIVGNVVKLIIDVVNGIIDIIFNPELASAAGLIWK